MKKIMKHLAFTLSASLAALLSLSSVQAAGNGSITLAHNEQHRHAGGHDGWHHGKDQNVRHHGKHCRYYKDYRLVCKQQDHKKCYRHHHGKYFCPNKCTRYPVVKYQCWG